jgi:hypothetical protein
MTSRRLYPEGGGKSCNFFAISGSFHETAEVVNSLQVSNRRYDEMQADFALVPLTISGMSQEEAL